MMSHCHSLMGMNAIHCRQLQFSLIATLLLLCPAATLPPQLTAAEKTTVGTLLDGTPQATPFYVCDSGQPGPVVMVTGGVHGDEPAGAAAAERIRHWHVGKGKLIVVPMLNVRGLAAQQRTMPGLEATLADLNRDFAHVNSKGESPRGRPAKEIWQFVLKQQPDWLVDLHEARTLHGTGDDSVGNALLVVPSPELTEAEPALLKAVNATIADRRYRFIVGRRPKDTTLARAAGEHMGIHAFIIETAKAGQTLQVRVAEHCAIVSTLLTHLGMEVRTEKLWTER
ncbi:MAG: succinylglutamate desuccinylase/aspartoacylase family protein [Thermoguttaceae bacterium]|jgi:predicted deacylase